jgi:uncharacterized protein
MKGRDCRTIKDFGKKSDFSDFGKAGSVRPTMPHERTAEVDILRGLAVFAMVLWNFNSHSMGNYYNSGRINYVTCCILTVLDFENTAHLLFAFLFGWGAAMQMRFSEKFAGVYLRRLSGLFVLGLIHSVFWYRPDFVHIFAVLGLSLFVFMKQSKRVILVSAVVLMGVPVFGRFVLGKFVSPDSYYGYGIYHSLNAQSIMSLEYSELVFLRMHEFFREYLHPHGYVRNMDILAAFLLGLYTFRRGVFQDVPGNISFLRKVLWGSLAVRLLGSGWVLALREFGAVENGKSDWMQGAYYLLSLHGRPDGADMFIKLYSIQALCVFYVSLITLLMQKALVKRVFLPFAKVGQMAISNYFLHSLIGTTLFYGYGFGLYGKLGCAVGESVAVLVFGFQMGISNFWLRYFRFGPIEWVWRALTYWNLKPMRVTQT